MLRNLLKPRYPRLDWIQVEITSQCNSSCRYCPQSAYRKYWQSRQMPLKIFESLVPAFKKTWLVYLQGWGEPFLHPDLFDMIRIAKAAGAKVGTTTNGTLLSRPIADRLVDEGLDIIGFSLAGITDDNDRIRKGTHLSSVLRAIEDLQQTKKTRGAKNPDIHIAYLLLRSNIEEIERLPEFFANLGAHQVVVSSLSLVTRPEWSKEAILADSPDEWSGLALKLQQIQDMARQKGVDLHFQLVSPFAQPVPCDENIQRALVVGAGGNVSPCVMTNIPVNGEATYYFNQDAYPLPHLSFGNIFDHSLNDIWRRPDFQKFRRRFVSPDLPAICRRCYKSHMITIERQTETPAQDLVPDF